MPRRRSPSPRGFAGDTPNIDNEITIASPIQVTLNVRIAEMSRTVVRNLGINWQALGTIGSDWRLSRH